MRRVLVAYGALALIAAQKVRAQPQPEEAAPPPPPPTESPPAEAAPPPPPEESPPAEAPPPAAPSVVVAAPAVVEDTGYPMAYADRPLILPNSAIEGSANLRYTDPGDSYTYKSVFLDPRARIGLPNAEVELATFLLLHQSQENLDPMIMVDSPLLASLYGAGRFALDPNLAIGGELAVYGPTTDYTVYQPRAVIATRQHLARNSAIDVSFATGINKMTTPDGASAIYPKTFVASLRGRVIAQASPNFAAEVSASLTYFNPLDEDPAGSRPASRATDYAVRFIATPSREIDIVFGAEMPTTEVITAFVGVAARRLP